MVEVDTAVLLKMQNIITTLQGQVEELLAFKYQHVGYDVATNVGYVHPNQKIRLAEFGGGASRIGPEGLQIIANTYNNAIWYVMPTNGGGTNPSLAGFFNNPTIKPPIQYSQIYGNNIFSDYRSEIVLYVDGNTVAPFFGPYASVEVDTYSTLGSSVGLFAQSPSNPGPQYRAGWYVEASPDPGGFSDISVVGGAPVIFGLRTTDPPFPGTDGSIWSRTDLHKYRGRTNGATDNFAMEAWVTAGFAPIAPTYAQSLMLMGA